MKQHDTTFVFGHERPLNWLCAETAAELLQEARSAQQAMTDIPLATLFDVLDKVGAAWQRPDYPLRRQAAALLPDLLSFSPAMVEAGLDIVGHLCRRETLEQRLSGEFAFPEALDRWWPRPELGHEVRALPCGPVLHLAAGNVFLSAVDSLVSGITTKNANVLKMSRVDPLFPPLFLQSIREFDPDGQIWRHQAAVWWRGGDTSIEAPLLGSDLTVVFWGGAEALHAVRRQIGLHTRLIENGPRYSFALIEGSLVQSGLAEEQLRGLALDVCRWDQQACSSPHVVYVIDTHDDNVHRLMDALVPHLQEVSRTLPRGALSFDEKVEIRRVRELAAMAEMKKTACMRCPEDFSFTLIHEQDPAFKFSCLNRTLFFKRVSSADELLKHIAPLGKYLQTVGLEVAAERRSDLESQLLAVGARRIAPLGGMSEGKNGAPHEGRFLLADLVSWVSREQRDGLPGRLQMVLQKAARAPFYQKALSGTGVLSLSSVPLLDRETFYRHAPPASKDLLTGPLTDAYVYASGGTTGDPKFTFYANDEYRRVTDILTFIYRQAGLNESDIAANIFIAGNLWTSFNVAGRALENLGCLHLPIGGNTDFANMIAYIQAFQVTALVGLPSIIVKLAEEIERRAIKVHIPKVLYGGEHLRPPTVAYLEKVLGCTWVRSAGYACVDTGPIGWQCAHLNGAVHHELDQYQFMEILDPAKGTPCTDDIPGEIVATNLDRTLMPVLRYRTGDLGRWSEPMRCPCGFSGRTFELLGRCDDLLVIGGINLLPNDVATGLGRLPVSPTFQIVARLNNGKEHLLLRLEAEKPLPEKQVREALQEGSYKLAKALSGGWIGISLEWVAPGGLPANPRTGKVKVVLDER